MLTVEKAKAKNFCEGREVHSAYLRKKPQTMANLPRESGAISISFLLAVTKHLTRSNFRVAGFILAPCEVTQPIRERKVWQTALG